jgi:preprotein translocase subunit SecE
VSDITSGNAATPERRTPRGGQVERRNVFSRLGLWWRQIVAELRKVIWPTRKELVAYTTVTLVFAVFMIALVAGLDFGANWLVLKVFS